MVNILYTFLVIYFPDVMPTLAALTGGTQYLPQNINGMNILPLFYFDKVMKEMRTPSENWPIPEDAESGKK